MGPTVRAILIAALAACGGRAASPPPAQPVPASPTPPAAAVAGEPPPPEEDGQGGEGEGEFGVGGIVAPPAGEPTTAEFDPAPPVVKLLSKGKGKRETLRYVAKVGDRFDCTMVMDLQLKASVTVVIPTTTMGFSGAVDAVDGGAITVNAVVDVFDVATSPDPLTQQMGQEMRTKLAPLMGATMVSTVSERGVPGHSKIVTRGPVDPATAMGMQMGAGGGVVLPAEAIGVGARWSVVRVEQTGLMTVRSTATFELIERKAGVAHIRGEIESISTPLAGDPVTGHGTSDGNFTGALCAESSVTMTVAMGPPVGGVMTTVMTTAPRAD